jgi:hypothetical protein
MHRFSFLTVVIAWPGILRWSEWRREWNGWPRSAAESGGSPCCTGAA